MGPRGAAGSDVHHWGPIKRWLWVIGRAEDDKCECGVADNAVHLFRCPLVGDWKGRVVEEASWDPEWGEVFEA